LTHTFLVLVTVGLDHGVYRKLYTLIGGQRAEKSEKHWFISFVFKILHSTRWHSIRIGRQKYTLAMMIWK